MSQLQNFDTKNSGSPVSGGTKDQSDVLSHGSHRFSLILLDNSRKFVKSVAVFFGLPVKNGPEILKFTSQSAVHCAGVYSAHQKVNAIVRRQSLA